MFSHMTIGTNDLDKAIVFYDGVMAALGHKRRESGDGYAAYGEENETLENSLWILTPINGKPATGGNGTNVGLLAPARASVDNFHAKAMELGGIDDGKPGLRLEDHENFYAAYVYDPDGNKLIAVCHNPPE